MPQRGRAPTPVFEIPVGERSIMKLWKILWVTLLALAVIFGMVACDETPADTTLPEDTDPTEVTQPETTEPETTEPETTEPETTKPETTETETTEPPLDTTDTPHEHSFAPVKTVAGTCLAEGYTVYQCSCGETKNADTTPKGDHTYKKNETPATCSAAGKIVYTCEVCGHSYEEAGEAAKGHYPAEGAKGVVVAPTCQSEGYTTYTCASCQQEYKADPTDKLACNYSTLTVPGTCIVPTMYFHTCEWCGNSHATSGTTVPHNIQTVFKGYGETYSGGTVDCYGGIYETACQWNGCDLVLGVERRLIGLDFNVADGTTFADYLSTVIGIDSFIKNGNNNAAGKIQNGVFTITKTQQSLTVPDFDLTGLDSFRISFDAKVYDMAKDGRMLGFGRGSYGSAAAVYYFSLGLNADNQIFVAKNTTKTETYTTYTMDSSKWHHIDLEVDMVKRTLTIYAGYYTDGARTKLEGYVEVGTYDDFFKADTADRAVELLSFSNGAGKTPTPVEFLDNYEITISSGACADAHTLEDHVVAADCEADGYTVSMCKLCGAATVTVDEGSNLGGHSITAFVETKDGVETWKCANAGCDVTETRNCVFGKIQHVDKTCTTDGGDYRVCENAECGYEKWINKIPASHALTVYEYDKDGKQIGAAVEGIPTAVPAEKMVAGAISYEYRICADCTFGEWCAFFVDLDFNAATGTTLLDYLKTVAGIGGFVKGGTNYAAGKIQDGAFSIAKTQQSMLTPDANLESLGSFRISFDVLMNDMTSDAKLLGFGKGGETASISYFFMLGVDASDHIFVAKNWKKNMTYSGYTVDRTKWQHFDLDVDMTKKTVTISVGYYDDSKLTTVKGYTTLGTFANFHSAGADMEVLSFANGNSSAHTAVQLLDNYKITISSEVTR